MSDLVLPQGGVCLFTTSSFPIPPCVDFLKAHTGVLQVDVTSKTEGKAFADATGVPLLVKYDTRIRDGVAKGVVQDVTSGIEVTHGPSLFLGLKAMQS